MFQATKRLRNLNLPERCIFSNSDYQASSGAQKFVLRGETELKELDAAQH